MELNQANLSTLFRAVKANYLKGRELAKQLHTDLATIITSTTGGEIIPVDLLSGRMREWIGARLVNHLNTMVVTAINKPYEFTVEIPKTAIDDDQYGLYTDVMAKQSGFAAAGLWDELMFAAMIANGNWADGAAFFVANRKYGKNTINNITNGALTPATFDTARQTMRAYLDQAGKSLKVNPDTLIVGPKLETMGRRIVENAFWYDGTDKVQIDNPYKGLAKLVVSDELVGDYDDYWFLLDNRQPLRPFAVVKREDGTMARQDRAEDDCVFTNGVIRYGANSRGVAVGALPHLAYAGIL
jgi:phage major head subunit gpT-like protein